MTTNNNDIKKEVSGITLKDSKNNKLNTKNTSLGISPNHTQTNSDDINVAQRNSQDDELMKKIFPHKEVINGKIVSVFPYIEEVYPLKDVPQEVVSKMEKTIDHISQEGKKLSLTEQWRKDELERGKKYWCKLTDGTSEICYLWLQTNHFTFLTGYQSKCLPDEYISEVLAPVPSYEQYRTLQKMWVDELDRATRFKKALEDVCDEYNQRLPILEAENQQLKELLKECKSSVLFEADVVKETSGKHSKDYKMLASILTKIDEVLE